MVRIEIHEDSCRGCEMCVDICPTDVFTFDQEKRLPQIAIAEDCIACLSCSFICPSGAVQHFDFPAVKNFYRDIEFCRRVERFL